ncbi:MAG: uroporphyrinogen decarboxylase [Eubacteriaceae bacterium]|nr:uroporphyrinogen decarboxylase [Eubacteriaceae bacterium]
MSDLSINPQELLEFRTKMMTDVCSNVIPERFPLYDGISYEYMLKYAGDDLLVDQYSMTEEKLLEIFEKSTEISRGDVFSGMYARNANALMLQRSKNQVMSSNGMFQHPEVRFMEVEDYDDFIANAYDWLVEVYQPRVNASYDADGAMRALFFLAATLAANEQNAIFTNAARKHREKYGLFDAPPGTSGSINVPFDRLADTLRSFTQINMDLRRCPDKVLAALDAYMPISIFRARLAKPNVLGGNAIMTHMGTFLSQKHFEKFYWPTFNELVHISAEAGIPTTIFCEENWDRLIDNLADLPQGSRMWIEYGTPQMYKDKIGKKFVLGGFYPIVLLRNGTKEQVVDKAKEIVDALAPGGNYFFRFDKSALNSSDINPENYHALYDYLEANAKYDNAGQQVSSTPKEDTITKGLADKYPKLQSKYLVDFEDFKKVYPPAAESAEPLMKAQFNKFMMQAFAQLTP